MPGPWDYPTNFGQSLRLNRQSRIRNQYGQSDVNGVALADGDFAEVFDSRRDGDSSELRQYCIQTMIGGYQLPSGEVDNRKVAILGRIEWGIGGVSMMADFDWKMGNQLSVAASFIRLSAAYSETEDTPQEVGVMAMFSSGGRAARSQVTRSYPQLTMTGGDVAIIPIPPMAHALNLFDASGEDFYDDGIASIRYVGGVSNGFSSGSSDLCSWVSDGAPFLQALATEDGVRFPEAARFVEISFEAENQNIYLITPCFTLNF